MTQTLYIGLSMTDVMILSQKGLGSRYTPNARMCTWGGEGNDSLSVLVWFK